MDRRVTTGLVSLRAMGTSQMPPTTPNPFREWDSFSFWSGNAGRPLGIPAPPHPQTHGQLALYASMFGWPSAWTAAGICQKQLRIECCQIPYGPPRPVRQSVAVHPFRTG
ncbi:hypothetical protein GCM10010264_36420 [Streptomyces globisporus]|nr:hypothetical protein GCM10010264_36420 [Streptomyces globisporus]